MSLKVPFFRWSVARSTSAGRVSPARPSRADSARPRRRLVPSPFPLGSGRRHTRPASNATRSSCARTRTMRRRRRPTRHRCRRPTCRGCQARARVSARHGRRQRSPAASTRRAAAVRQPTRPRRPTATRRPKATPRTTRPRRRTSVGPKPGRSSSPSSRRAASACFQETTSSNATSTSSLTRWAVTFPFSPRRASSSSTMPARSLASSRTPSAPLPPASCHPQQAPLPLEGPLTRSRPARTRRLHHPVRPNASRTRLRSRLRSRPRSSWLRSSASRASRRP
jgi:hypothetical protein